ncbi:MAG TPA: methylmalonyl Co-A mutase-associated GTPase MeaB [Nitrososphaeraceae archaeon]|jgi:LAO/AO transport system kinase|nr:methylmalonyl Co-A mutase-associated GTPase MeaB [Nitrososphaeraceae archaeon]
MLPIVKGILEGERRSLSRAISIVDNDEPDSKTILKQIYNKTGNAKTLGFTGPGGAGKSSLIGKLVPEFQAMGYKMAILAVDPTSPITGGAILGDRVRMQTVLEDDTLFMRSMASRGAMGGISHSLRNVIRVLDAAGYDLILIESVGAGQLEVEISKVVNMTAVVFTPNTGDNVQAIKAGLSEIGDLYIINKGDLAGATSLFHSILDLIGNTERKPVVIKASARTGMGIKELAHTIDKLLRAGRMDYKEKEKKMIESELRDMVLNMIEEKVSYMLSSNKKYYDYIEKLISKKVDPYCAAEQLAQEIWR